MATAWQKREMEHRAFINGFYERVAEQADDAHDPDQYFLIMARWFLEAVIGERVNMMEVTNPEVVSILTEINGFARTRAEAGMLKQDFLQRLLESGFHATQTEHLRERVHEQEKLYVGHGAMDEVELSPRD